MSIRRCPHPDCSAEIPIDRFACRSHWFGLPSEIRTAINAAYRRLWRGGGLEPLEAAQAEAFAYWAEVNDGN